MSIIKREWGKISPEFPMDYFFLDQAFDNNYKQEMQAAFTVNILTLIAIILSCLGLFGLALFNISGRIKELGVRKVNGAKAAELLAMLNKDLVTWVIIAYILACPVAWYAAHQWLQSFAYKTTLSWWTFALAGLLALGVALLTVSFQSWRAATRNPVETLHYE